MSLLIDLSDQVVLVTGGTRGIGNGIVEQMLKAGARVALCAPDQAECDQVAAKFNKDLKFDDERAIGVAGNLYDRNSLTALVNSVLERWGKIDTLVCNAADFGAFSKVEDASLETFVRVLENNVVNNFHLCRLVLPQMEQRGSGAIILITSIAGHSAMPANIAYSSSKAALTNMARGLAADYAAKGIRINCISPGLIRSEASRDLLDNKALAANYIREKIPMNRVGEPTEIGTACVFLASPLASYITSATVPVDGGRLGVGLSSGSTEQIKKA